jgi:hypothetical protein
MVAKLNASRQRGFVHPFTCGGNRSDEAHRMCQRDAGQLAATTGGWVSPVCGYRQDWARDFMLAIPGIRTPGKREAGSCRLQRASSLVRDAPENR